MSAYSGASNMKPGESGRWNSPTDGAAYQVLRNDSFLNFGRKGSSTDDLSGWKLHISIDPRDMEKAWRALIPFFSDHGKHTTQLKNF